MPDLIQIAKDCEDFGAQGITVHPRPDERHVKFSDLQPLKDVVKTEFNIEGYPSAHFINQVCLVKPHQVTLVPDSPDALTSDAGWNTIKHGAYLSEIISQFHQAGIRTSLFIDPQADMLEAAAKTGTDRIEFYTGPYAHEFKAQPHKAVATFSASAVIAHNLGLGINAGHDLNLDNLKFFRNEVPHLEEVSIGHALVCDALYLGLKNTIQLYLKELSDV